MSWLGAITILGAAAWVWLLLGHGGFWRCSQRLAPAAATPGRDTPPRGPGVAVVIPARDEADVIAPTLRSLLEQPWPGPLTLFVVDDGSSDGTGDIARGIGDRRITVIEGTPLPAGWSGKLWAQQQGLDRALRDPAGFDYVLLSDADIAHGADSLTRLVSKAERGSLDLVSLMVRLHCASGWERLLVPAFVFFFQKLYPFPWVNRAASRTAAAAGGCMLVRRAALQRMGGLEPVRHALIDDCALAAAIKARGGRIWLGLAEDSCSLRRYDRLGPMWRMVARTAYTQLRHSPLLLLGTVLGMLLLYALGPLLLLSAPWHGDAVAAAAGALQWALMTLAYLPVVHYYRQPVWRALTLPVAAMLYTGMTVDSAVQHWRGRGGGWKGRHYGDLGSETSGP
jgi:hopene-associated glycosyltransferase HpnB